MMGRFNGWTGDKVADILAKEIGDMPKRVFSNNLKSLAAKKCHHPAQTPQERTRAIGRMPGGKMNKTEAAYGRLLETRLGLGEIRWYAFEPINIRLGANCFYRVDFMVMLASGEIEAHEVKGHWEDDALVKFKAAAHALPFRFKAVRMTKGNFETILEI